MKTLREVIGAFVNGSKVLDEEVSVVEVTRGPKNQVVGKRKVKIAFVSGSGDIVVEASEWKTVKP